MKQKTGRKLLSILLTLAMVIGLMPGMSLTVYAETSTWTSGDCTVTYDTETNTVTVKKTNASSATGNMADYGMDSDDSVPVSPWNDIKGSFQKIVIEDGVTGIGNYAFINCDSIKNITIPASVTNIGERAFETPRYGIEVTFVRPSSESSLTVANDAFYYSATLAYSDGGNYSLFAGDSEIELSGSYNGEKLNGKTLTWKLPIFSITDNSVNGSVTASVGGSDVTKAEVGNTVTLTVAPASGYQFKSITASSPKDNPENFSDLVSLMGTAEFAGQFSCTGYTCKVENGKFVVYNGTTLVTEAAASNVTDFSVSADWGNNISCSFNDPMI